MKKLTQAALWVSLSAIPFTSAQSNVDGFAKITGDTCFACHGPSGKGVPGGSIPPIAGKDAGYLTKVLKDFKSGKRASTIMQRHAKGYTDAEIEAIAKYLSQIK